MHLFDPRGKSAVLDTPAALRSFSGRPNAALVPPTPPFHRVHEVRPEEGMLVLFPGWLIHDVKQSVGLHAKKDGYRISISMNLKGEWQDTTGLKLVAHGE